MNPAESKNTSYLSFQACRFLYLNTHQSQIGSSQQWALKNCHQSLLFVSLEQKHVEKWLEKNLPARYVIIVVSFGGGGGFCGRVGVKMIVLASSWFNY